VAKPIHERERPCTCDIYAALAAPAWPRRGYYAMASGDVDSPPSPKRSRLSGAASYGTKFNSEWTALFPFSYLHQLWTENKCRSLTCRILCEQVCFRYVSSHVTFL